ncbi:MAG: MerR family transcriptional regulator [Halanaerobiales bacterium]|nr:MerR family transcriptional regulator [Halanaerobiales bacterium]
MMDRKDRPIYSMVRVRQMTGLTDRQIRYYEEAELIKPRRTRGKQRIFSPSEVERLREIKILLENGLNISMVKEELEFKEHKPLDLPHIDPAITLPGIERGLRSIYPVSNRAQLVNMVVKRRREKERETEK